MSELALLHERALVEEDVDPLADRQLVLGMLPFDALDPADIGRTDLRLGQTATVLVAMPPVPGVIKLPLTAVFEQGGQTSVWLVDRTAMTVRPQPIAVAGADGGEGYGYGPELLDELTRTKVVHLGRPTLRGERR